MTKERTLANVSKLKTELSSIDTLHFGNEMFEAISNIFWFTLNKTLKLSTECDNVMSKTCIVLPRYLLLLAC